MHCYTQCLQPCSRPPLTHTSAGDSETPTGKSRTVSCGVTAPFSWVLVHKVLLCPPRVYFPGLCKFWQLYGRVNGGVFLVVFKWWISAVKPLNPEFFFVEIFITDSVSLLVTGLFRFSIFHDLVMNLSVSSRLSNLLMYSYFKYSHNPLLFL